MITLSADWLRGRWPELMMAGTLPMSLSRWDDGDAFTLAELGPLSAPERVHGCIVLGQEQARQAVVIVRLVRDDESGGGRDSGLFHAPDGQVYLASGRCFEEAGRERELPVQIVEVAGALEQRRAALLETSLLADTAVAVIGLGTGGVHVSIELAKAGVGHFAVVDEDRLDVGNVARHHAGVSHSGRRKVYVARDLILEKNPAARVDVHPVSAGPETENLLRGIVDAADVVVCATDGRPSKLFINRLGLAAAKPTIYGGAFRRAYGGQVLRVRPGVSPCYQCFVMAMPEEEEDQEVASERDALEIAYSDRPIPIEPGLSLDVAPIALMVSRLALNELLADRETTLVTVDRDLAAPWYLWVNRPEPDTPYATWPPLSESSDEMTILRWYGIHFDREPACPACGDFGSAMRQAYGLDEDQEAELPHPPLEVSLPWEEE